MNKWWKLAALGGVAAAAPWALESMGVGAGGGAGGLLGANAPAGLGDAADATTGTASASNGMLDALKTAGSYARPAMEGMQAAQMAQGLLGPKQQPIQAPPMQMQQGGQNPIATLLTQQAQLEQMRRQMRYGYGTS